MAVSVLPELGLAAGKTKLWRYFDLPKFQSLIERQALYFASAREFEDRFEGSIPQSQAIRLRESTPEIMVAHSSKAFEELRRLTKISCWHMNEGESAAMWSLYVREKCGIAIRSTVDRLVSALQPYRIEPHYAEERVWVGPVRYIDYRTDHMQGGLGLGRFFHKRRSFAHEQEFRSVLQLDLAEEFGVRVPEKGVFVPVDMHRLCEAVHLAPETDKEFRHTVEALITHARLSIPVFQSEMDDAALY
ncbi:DUF2971 domain-containing protein [Microvirga sp. KLBC 81]|uniref:DUF2971 domain-containing protein n=1 Tax=Microvirga sp. KLBC 81 TaxID=1862707 RepID=UPI000D525181|nr:DUF2971 domain-containing protein [Microvirga sp. KLBC 81]PVE23900.1 DUF2971 domain-containing protein [Microvirga sp. KLBC 81]